MGLGPLGAFLVATWIERVQPLGELRFGLGRCEQLWVPTEQTPQRRTIPPQKIFQTHRVIAIELLGGGRNSIRLGDGCRGQDLPHDHQSVSDPRLLPQTDELRNEGRRALIRQEVCGCPAE